MSGEIARLGSAFFLVRRPGADLRKLSAEVTSSEFHHGKNLRSPAGKSVSRSAARRLHGLPEKVRNSWRGLPRSPRKPHPARLLSSRRRRSPARSRPRSSARMPIPSRITCIIRRTPTRRSSTAWSNFTATSPRPGSLRPPMRWSRTTTPSSAPCRRHSIGVASRRRQSMASPCASISAARCCLSIRMANPSSWSRWRRTIATGWASWPTTFSRNWSAACATQWRRQSVRSPQGILVSGKAEVVVSVDARGVVTGTSGISENPKSSGLGLLLDRAVKQAQFTPAYENGTPAARRDQRGGKFRAVLGPA